MSHGPFGRGVDPTQRSKNFGATLRRLLAWLRPERVRITAVFVLTVLSVFLHVLGPKLLGDATNIIVEGVIGRSMPADMTREEIIEAARAAGDTARADMLSGMQFVPGQGINFGALTTTILIVLGLFVLAGVMNLIAGRMLTRVVQRVGFELREEVQAKIDRLPLSYLDNTARGDILSRVTNDIDNVTQSMQQTLSNVINSVVTVAGIIGMMLWISLPLAGVTLILVPLAAVVLAIIAKKSQPQFVRQWKATGDLGGIVEEAFTGQDVIAAFGAQDRFSETFGESNETLRDSSFRAQFLTGTMQPAMMFLSNLSYVAVAVVGGLMVAGGGLTIGAIQAFIQYSRQFTQPLAQLASMANLIQSAVASAERTFEILDAEEMVPDTVTTKLPAQVGDVHFEGVSFAYTPGVTVIDDLELHAAPGQTVAIVGPTGAGKTTLVNLLMRFYEIDGGRIKVEGVDTATISKDDLRSKFGMVLQDTWLVEDTIRANIAFGQPSASEEEIYDAARSANLDHHIRTLPDGYDTKISDDSLSAGEKQLLTIARAFLVNPQILILDEATSSVDTRTELLVQQAMARLKKGRTSFIIAHRLSTIRDADVIVVMEEGSVVEQGRHEELIAAGGAYARLYQAQFEAPQQYEDPKDGGPS